MLTKNALEERICIQLASMRPDFRKVLEACDGENKLTRNSNRFNWLRGSAAEFALRFNLEHLAKDDKQIVLDPIPQGTSYGPFMIEYNASGCMAIKIGKENYTELDQIVLIDGLPIIFEVKLKPLWNNIMGQENIRSHWHFMGLRDANGLLPYGGFAEIMQEIFGSQEFGYALISHRATIRRGKPSPYLARFRELGGQTISFFESRELYSLFLLEEAKKLGIELGIPPRIRTEIDRKGIALKK